MNTEDRTGNFIRDIEGSFYVIVLKNDVTITWWTKGCYFYPTRITTGGSTIIQVADGRNSHVRNVEL
jgi:hypothetical protein